MPLLPQRLEDLERRVGVRRVLHVDAHEEPVRVGRLEDAPQVVDAVARSTSRPSCVSFSEMLRSMPDATIASMMRDVLARRRRRRLGGRDALAEVVERQEQALARQIRARAAIASSIGLAGDEAAREARPGAMPYATPAACRWRLREA